ncbi:hypothetical protein A2W32_01655 [candidate division WWE3 bacterium RBG_16_37_10]|uniref:Uncharacterized protein n=1 Tax=candidate division WWE3 bacterium RBG_16_37_10 TaxID=1802610 RepID=A0A1F4USW1_UNCKA|nr:MAG: hypothetical protein A2W32_01655 [candidate division WWE3 bacterium RBG_16_37_10]
MIFVLVLGLYNRVKYSRSSYSEYRNIEIKQDSQTSASIEEPPIDVELNPEPIEPYEYFSNLGKEISDNSYVSIIKNEDGTIDIYNIIQNTPEVIIKSAFEASARKWILEFMKGVYTSDYKVRYVQMSVTWLYAGVRPTQVGLGINQAKSISKEEWENITPYDFCIWLMSVSEGKNDNDFANSTYSKDFVCR